MGVEWDGRERLVWAVAVYKEGLGCMTVWAKWGPWRGSGLSRRVVERIRVILIGCPGRLGQRGELLQGF
jgi:hypothetical protein